MPKLFILTPGASAHPYDSNVALRGTPIGPYDVLIAGQAKARDVILVTHNTTEFGRVPGLRIADWERGRGKRRQ